MLKRMIALMLALALVIIGAAAAEGAEDPVLLTVNGQEIRESDADLQFWVGYLISNSGADPDTDLLMIQQYAMDYNIRYTIMQQKLAEAGKTITQEEIDAFAAEAKGDWDSIVESIMEEEFGVGADASDEDKTAARADTLAYIEASYGYTEAKYIEEQATVGRLIWAEEQVSEIAAEGIEVSDEEAEAYFLSIVEEDKQMLAGMAGEDLSDEELLESMVGAYEIYGNYYGYQFTYTPEGYRAVTHILLPVDEALLSKWQDLKARLEEQEESTEATDEGADAADPDAAPEETVTPEMVKEAEQAILDSIQDKLDEIQAKLADGASFDDLILEYGTDPGMADDATRAEGYPVHRYSLVYDTDFKNCAMSLANPGEWSEPVVSQFGVHILYYLRDIPGGPMEYTDEVKVSMKEALKSEAVEAAMSELVDKWITESEIVWTEAGEAGWKMAEEPQDTEAAPAE